MAHSWDGWVLYTASNGHKYHYNHLTHESRWAVDQRAEDHKAEEHFQQYLRQRASAIDPDEQEQDRSDRLDAAEAGNDEDSDEDNPGVLHSSAVVSPYAGVGPMTMPTASDREPPRTAGFVGRVSGALRMAMAKVERSQRGGEGESRGVVDKEWDPELGQTDSKRRGREGWGRGVAAGAGSRSSGCTERSSSESSSSESSSSESSSSSGSDESSDIDSAAHTGDGHTRRRRSGGPSTTRRQSGRSSRGSEAAEPPRSPKGDRITSYRSVVNLRSSSSSRRRLERSRHRRESRRSRNRRSSRRHYSRQRKVDAKRRSEAYSSAEGSRVAQTAAIDGLADLGRQAVASVAKIALRAVLGSWKGVTTAAVKAIRTLQVNADTRNSGLPMVVTNTPHIESPEAPRTCQLEDEWWGGEERQGDRAPYRSFMPMAAPPRSSSQRHQEQRPLQPGGGRFTGGPEGRSLAWSEQNRGQGAETAAPGGQVVEGFREEGNDPTSSPEGSWGGDEGEGGYSRVLIDGGIEERKDGLTSPPQSWRRVSV